MTAREHLQRVHEHHAEHHRQMAKVHTKLGEHHRALADQHAEEPELFRTHGNLAEAYEKAAGHHEKAAEFHDECAKAVGSIETIKTAGGSGIAPRDPNFNQDRSDIRKVTNFGQPTEPEGIEDVPAEYADLCKTE